MDRDKEWMLEKLTTLIASFDYDIEALIAEYTQGYTDEEVLYQMWEAGILDLDLDEPQLELDFE